MLGIRLLVALVRADAYGSSAFGPYGARSLAALRGWRSGPSEWARSGVPWGSSAPSGSVPGRIKGPPNPRLQPTGRTGAGLRSGKRSTRATVCGRLHV
jgi:hypothetical protein